MLSFDFSFLEDWTLIQSGNSLRLKAEDKGSRQMVRRFLGDQGIGMRLMVEGQEEAKCEATASTVIATVIATTDAPVSPHVKRTDSRCPQTPEEVGTVIIPLSGWRTEGQKDEVSQKNRATHQTQTP